MYSLLVQYLLSPLVRSIPGSWNLRFLLTKTGPSNIWRPDLKWTSFRPKKIAGTDTSRRCRIGEYGGCVGTSRSNSKWFWSCYQTCVSSRILTEYWKWFDWIIFIPTRSFAPNGVLNNWFVSTNNDSLKKLFIFYSFVKQITVVDTTKQISFCNNMSSNVVKLNQDFSPDHERSSSINIISQQSHTFPFGGLNLIMSKPKKFFSAISKETNRIGWHIGVAVR